MKRYLGIELGSTRIKAVLIGENAEVLAQGGYEWENVLTDGLWSYDLSLAREGLSACYADLIKDYGEPIEKLDAIGISAMMHGYLAFNDKDELLVPFRTWRNTNTGKAAGELSSLFSFNVPMRWSVSHFYQAVLNGEKHVSEVAYLTTLSGYIHYLLTGKKVIGVGDASGMFPIGANKQFDNGMLNKFDSLLKEKGLDISFENLLPTVLTAGDPAGVLTEEGARLLDPTGHLQSGCPLCPPEGDAGTGMVATNSIAPRTANISAGTSAFLMAVLERPLSRPYASIDIVTTPVGDPVAMVHANNCTNEINAWVNLFSEVLSLFGKEATKGELFTKLFNLSMQGEADSGKLIGYNFLAGEHVADVETGTLLLARPQDGHLSLANLMQTQIFAAVGTLAYGMDVLRTENVSVDRVLGHGGFFKSPSVVGQSAMSAAIGAPVTVMETAGEGGAYGMALLAAYLDKDIPFADYLNSIFANAKQSTVSADDAEKAKFASYMERYRAYLPILREASEMQSK